MKTMSDQLIEFLKYPKNGRKLMNAYMKCSKNDYGQRVAKVDNNTILHLDPVLTNKKRINKKTYKKSS